MNTPNYNLPVKIKLILKRGRFNGGGYRTVSISRAYTQVIKVGVLFCAIMVGLLKKLNIKK